MFDPNERMLLEPCCVCQGKGECDICETINVVPVGIDVRQLDMLVNNHKALVLLNLMQNACEPILSLLPNEGTDGKAFDVVDVSRYDKNDYDVAVLGRSKDALGAVRNAAIAIGFDLPE